MNNHSIPSTNAERKITVRSHTKLFNSISLSALTDRRTDRQTEEEIHLLRVGRRNFFSSCVVVSVFLVVTGNSFWCYLEYQLCHCVSFLVAAGNSFGCTVSKKNSYSVSLMEKRSASQCVYFIRSKHSFTLYLSTLYISFVPYRSTDSHLQLFLLKNVCFLWK